MATAVAGVVLAGGALAALFYWNHREGQVIPKVASAESVPAAPAKSDPVSMTTPSAGTSLPLTHPTTTPVVTTTTGNAAHVTAPTIRRHRRCRPHRAHTDHSCLAAGAVSGKELANSGQAARRPQDRQRCSRFRCSHRARRHLSAKALLRELNKR